MQWERPDRKELARTAIALGAHPERTVAVARELSKSGRQEFPLRGGRRLGKSAREGGTRLGEYLCFFTCEGEATFCRESSRAS